MIKPTMSHAVNEAHLNELLVKYYENITSEYEQNLGTVIYLLKNELGDKALKECELLVSKLDSKG